MTILDTQEKDPMLELDKSWPRNLSSGLITV